MIHMQSFIEQVPDYALNKTDVAYCGDTVIFKPRVYIGDVSINVEDYHIVVLSENTPELLCNRRKINASRRSILAINPGDNVSCLTYAPAKPYYSVLIKPSLMQKISSEMNIAGEVSFVNTYNPYSPELYRVVRSLECESKRTDRLNLLVESLELQMGVILLRRLETNVKTHPSSITDTDAYVSLAEDYIRSNYSLNITLTDICDEIHVSKYHFIRMFNKVRGLTPHKYLIAVRMEKAKELLSSGHYSVTEVASLCGFESIPHFSETFKKSTGYTPVDFKSMH